MPDTYTKEQIADIVTALYGWTALPRILPSAPGTGPDWDLGADIRAVLAALEAAEQTISFYKKREKDICAAVGGVGDGGRYRADVIEHLEIIYEKAARSERFATYAAKLEKAGDFMRRACPMIVARDNWDAARKEKP